MRYVGSYGSARSGVYSKLFLLIILRCVWVHAVSPSSRVISIYIVSSFRQQNGLESRQVLNEMLQVTPPPPPPTHPHAGAHTLTHTPVLSYTKFYTSFSYWLSPCNNRGRKRERERCLCWLHIRFESSCFPFEICFVKDRLCRDSRSESTRKIMHALILYMHVELIRDTLVYQLPCPLSHWQLWTMRQSTPSPRPSTPVSYTHLTLPTRRGV